MFHLNTYDYFEELNLGLAKYAPKNKTILDVGSGFCSLDVYYRDRGNITHGIDNSPDVKNISKQKLNFFYLEDLTNFQRIGKILEKKRFDEIIFADVLEHIYDPVNTLVFYKKFLKQNGLIYISVPNLAVWYVRLQILFGNFNYTDTGTLDKTHIRFFTRNNVEKLATASQLEIVTLDITPGIARFFANHLRRYFKDRQRAFNEKALLESKVYRFYNTYIYPIEHFICKLAPGLLAYQYIVQLRKK